MLLVSEFLVAGNGGAAAATQARRGPLPGLRSDPSVAIKLWHSDCVCAEGARSTKGAVASGDGGGCAAQKSHG